jgi:hypothetical protein
MHANQMILNQITYEAIFLRKKMKFPKSKPKTQKKTYLYQTKINQNVLLALHQKKKKNQNVPLDLPQINQKNKKKNQNVPLVLHQVNQNNLQVHQLMMAKKIKIKMMI